MLRHLDTNGDGVLNQQEVANVIAAVAPGSGQAAAAAREVMDNVADPGSGSIDFAGFLHFFRMVRPCRWMHEPWSPVQLMPAWQTDLIAGLRRLCKPSCCTWWSAGSLWACHFAR